MKILWKCVAGLGAVLCVGFFIMAGESPDTGYALYNAAMGAANFAMLALILDKQYNS